MNSRLAITPYESRQTEIKMTFARDHFELLRSFLRPPRSFTGRSSSFLRSTLDADPEVEEAWAAEVERRQAEVENGTVSLLPGPETLTQLKAEFE